MLNTRLRKQIEWHFFNYRADLALINEKIEEITDSGLTARFDKIGGCSNTPSSPTESKALKVIALEGQKNWATVIRNTFNAFKFEPQYDIMTALYISGKSHRKIIGDGLWESTFYRWREEWLELALSWAKEFHLL